MEKGKCFYSIEKVIQANNEADKYFFSPDSKRFFKSRILSTVYKGQYFITSEKENWNDRRKYTIRRIDLNTHGIDTVGEFMGFSTKYQAVKEIERLPSP